MLDHFKIVAIWDTYVDGWSLNKNERWFCHRLSCSLGKHKLKKMLKQTNILLIIVMEYHHSLKRKIWGTKSGVVCFSILECLYHYGWWQSEGVYRSCSYNRGMSFAKVEYIPYRY